MILLIPRYAPCLIRIRYADHSLRLCTKTSFTIPVGPGVELYRFVYGYLANGRMITLIDAGVTGCDTVVFERICSDGRDPSEIARIILTHSHPDHTGAAQTIQRKTGCQIAAHPAERAWIEDVYLQNQKQPVPGFASLVSGSVQVDRELTEGGCIIPDNRSDLEMQVLHTHGHSPEMFCSDIRKKLTHLRIVHTIVLLMTGDHGN